MGAARAPDSYPTTGRQLHSLHAAVRTHGPTIAAAGLFRRTMRLHGLPLTDHGATGGTPNRSWDEALLHLGYPRTGQWQHYAPAGLWLAEVSNQHPGDHTPPDPARPEHQLYIVLTTDLPDSGLVVGPITAVTAAARTRLLHGQGAAGALVNAYLRRGDHLALLRVETTEVGTTGATRYRVETWLEQQLLSQDEFDA